VNEESARSAGKVIEKGGFSYATPAKEDTKLRTTGIPAILKPSRLLLSTDKRRHANTIPVTD